MKVRFNDNEEIVRTVKEGLRETGGYCPCRRERTEETKCICSMASHYSYAKQCMPREIYGTPVLLEFEGRQYYAPAQHNEYLQRLFGDYMQLPPEEQRQANLEIFTSIEYI